MHIYLTLLSKGGSTNGVQNLRRQLTWHTPAKNVEDDDKLVGEIHCPQSDRNKKVNSDCAGPHCASHVTHHRNGGSTLTDQISFIRELKTLEVC